ncbi:MAG: LD-carboxypeptidase [Erysipelotrichales bacterium]|nr:LD-carboxypeptidase [Erysipelotrichales bacterium]
MKINKPEKLKKGDKIGLICPSFCTDQNKISTTVSLLEELGFEVKVGKSVYAKNDYLAGSDKLRKNDLEEMFSDDSVKAIICQQGGYGATRLLDIIDYEIIKNNPKFFLGYSDITALNNAFYQLCGLPSYQGKIGAQLPAVRKDSFSYENFLEALFSNTKNQVLKNPTTHQAYAVTEGIAEGILVGGNLSLIYTLMGTPYDIDFKDKIIILEDVGEKPYAIDRMLQSLKLSGKLKEAEGFIVGQFTDCEPTNNNQDEQIRDVPFLIKEFLGGLNVPVLANFCNGHDMPYINLPIGLKVRLDASNHNITILEDFYK